MRNLFMSFLFVLLAAPALSATEADPVETVPEVVPTVVAEADVDTRPSMHLEEITIEERPATSDAAAAQLGPRGGFWWIVGVIVVAGIILTVIL